MSWRIERSDAVSLLRELPDDWAQTCVTSPPRTASSAEVLVVLSDVRRVLRGDGTLWLFSQPGELLEALVELGFHWQDSPRWAAPHSVSAGTRLLLLTKRPSFFCDAALDRPRLRRLRRADVQSVACRAQPMPCERELRVQLTRRCVLAGSSPIACGVCGAPYSRACPGAPRRATCVHNDRTGRCLVLDPFCRPGAPTAAVAHDSGRSFLGITDTRIGERP